MAGRMLAAVGAMLAAAGVALSAYAAHAAEDAARASLQSAALFALARRTGSIALVALLLGTLLFSGSLLGAHVFAWPTRLAPTGGMLMIAGWLLYAMDAYRR
jgi:uncharacterized membrane protein YgdD (TMEM256/DUF423 family)